MSFNIQEVIQAAINAPAYPRVLMGPYESTDAFSAGAVARLCAGFAQNNKAALTYIGASAAELQAELAGLDSKIEFHRNEVARLRSELIKQTGGADAVTAAAAAGLDVAFDQALVTGQHENERQRFALSQQRDKISSQLVTARQSGQARAELVSIISALIGGLV
ncbi:hypothetical protein P0D88_00995 [Paraburkholderia sp. RL18-103-BIB-C]|uniref:hypothetical protein n=1 Tax=Paraburkholderia sp. RL18-103-BIB-C TaxID=3031637 RepID=UPI0038BDBCBF